MKSILVFLVMTSLPSPAWAQSRPRPDPSATQPVAAAARGPSRASRLERVARYAAIGAGAGAATGWLLWTASSDRECPSCGESPEHAVFTTALFGATAGAWIGVVKGWGAGHPDIRSNRHVTVNPAVTRSQLGGAVRIAF